jgi:hypothetical protein
MQMECGCQEKFQSACDISKQHHNPMYSKEKPCDAPCCTLFHIVDILRLTAVPLPSIWYLHEHPIKISRLGFPWWNMGLNLSSMDVPQVQAFFGCDGREVLDHYRRKDNDERLLTSFYEAVQYLCAQSWPILSPGLLIFRDRDQRAHSGCRPNFYLHNMLY